MDALTLSYKTRRAKRTWCPYCKTDRKHHACYDPDLEKWIEICTVCEMVELADSELTKLGLALDNRGRRIEL